mmetsp:Transcript_153644/g.491279  ORF Transcript_153644/g.491279 Transcript_153644/m.491279 type:complete len:178 (+) Transcript_153644:430-963(+)
MRWRCNDSGETTKQTEERGSRATSRHRRVSNELGCLPKGGCELCGCCRRLHSGPHRPHHRHADRSRRRRRQAAMVITRDELLLALGTCKSTTLQKLPKYFGVGTMVQGFESKCRDTIKVGSVTAWPARSGGAVARAPPHRTPASCLGLAVGRRRWSHCQALWSVGRDWLTSKQRPSL